MEWRRLGHSTEWSLMGLFCARTRWRHRLWDMQWHGVQEIFFQLQVINLLYAKKPPQLYTKKIVHVQYFSLLSCLEAKKAIGGKFLKILYCKDLPVTRNANDCPDGLCHCITDYYLDFSVALKLCISGHRLSDPPSEGPAFLKLILLLSLPSLGPCQAKNYGLCEARSCTRPSAGFQRSEPPPPHSTPLTISIEINSANRCGFCQQLWEKSLPSRLVTPLLPTQLLLLPAPLPLSTTSWIC